MIHPMHLIGLRIPAHLRPTAARTIIWLSSHSSDRPDAACFRQAFHFLPTCTSARTVPTLVIFLPPPLMGKP